MRAITALCIITGLVATGCSGLDGVSQSGGLEGGLGVGADCIGREDECADGLACSSAKATEGTCQYEGTPGTAAAGAECLAAWECGYGLSCSSAGTCVKTGDPGTKTTGEACEKTDECQMFLACMDGVCAGFQPPFWAGASCEEPAKGNEPLKIQFDIRRSSDEFYRLPFPGDYLLKENGVDLSGHANPGILIPELGNPVGDYFDVIGNELNGFGTQTSVYFRFNRWPNNGAENFKRMENIYIVNVDSESEKYGEKASVSYEGNSGRGMYICYNWVAVAPSMGYPLLPGTKYAAVLTTDITNKDKDAISQDDDFAAMLLDTEPTDAALSKAWAAFEPLRAYLKNEAIEPSTIAAATVFTTGRPTEALPKIYEAVNSEPTPAVAEMTKDESGATYVLYNGKVTVPFYQDGKRPFAVVADGGAIKYDASGLPILVEEEQVKFALTVPKGDAPAEGWPIILYAHGTGGSEMSFVSNIASEMSKVGAAIIGLEQVQHGDRRGLSGADADLDKYSPEYMFYNFLNPRAARDNNLQAAADYFQLVRLVEEFQTISSEPVVFNMEKVYFFGHSQGTQGAFLSATYEPKIKGIILSGAGGNLLESLLGKKNPIDVSAAIKVALMDGSVGRSHPLLNLVQLSFESVDPVNYAPYVLLNTYPGIEYARRHVFMSYGIGDTYTPENTQIALARSLHLKQWPVAGHEIPAVGSIEELPHKVSIYSVTAVVVQYEPGSDYDGHFVIFQHPGAIKQSTEFVRTMIEDEHGVPSLVAP